MKISLGYTLALWFSVASGVAVAQQQPIVVVADEWPPFSGASLHEKGLAPHVINTVLSRAGYQVETRILPWARIMQMAKDNNVEVVGSLFYSGEMAAHVKYAEPFYGTEVRLVRRIGSGHKYVTVSDLEPLSIAVGAGFLYQDEFDSADYLNKVEVTTTLQAMRMVAAGRVDLTLDSVDVLDYTIKHDDPSLSEKIEIVPGAIVTQKIHMAVGKNTPNRDEIIADFNRVLSEMRNDGSLDEILRVHIER